MSYDQFSWLYEDGWYRKVRLLLTSTIYFRACEVITEKRQENEMIRFDVLKKVTKQINDNILKEIMKGYNR